jgi:hypothetical protein
MNSVVLLRSEVCIGPEVLLLDEPTEGVDRGTAEEARLDQNLPEIRVSRASSDINRHPDTCWPTYKQNPAYGTAQAHT